MNTKDIEIPKSDTLILPKGYKQTSIGVIPEDWKVKNLREIGKFYKGKGISKAELQENGFNAIRYGEIYTVHNLFVKEFYSFINTQSAKESFRIYSGDLLFTGSGETLEDIGKCVAYLSDEEAYAGGDIIILRPKKEDFNSKFLGLVTNEKTYKKQTYRVGQGNSVVHIYPSNLENVQLPIPPLDEQQKIAEVLSTWDSAIEKLSQLIAAKKQHKKGLMQQLLTGRLRLRSDSGERFKDEWTEVKLGEVGNFKTSSVNKIIEEGETLVRLLNYMDVYRNTHINSKIAFSKTTAKPNQIITSNLKVGDILFTPSSETPDDIGHSAVVIEELENVLFSYHLVRFRPKKNILDLGFSGYIFNKSEILNEFSRRATGSTRFTLSIKDFNEVTTFLPSLEEQTAIAQILSAADKEIALLEQKHKALQQQKKGLMQVLLTGKVRVV